MADGTVENTSIPQEVHDQMRLHLFNEVPQRQTDTQEQQVTQQEQVTSGEPQAVSEQQQVEPQPGFNFDVLKEKFSYQSPDEVVAALEDYKTLKSNPPKFEPTFENETSEKLFKALTSGKVEEVRQYLVEQDRLEKLSSLEVSDENADDIIKMSMQLKYRDLSPAEIEYKFKKEFELPKKPVYNDSVETEEDFNFRLKEWEDKVADIQMNKKIEAKLSKPLLTEAKSKLTLPTFESPTDAGYQQYQQLMKEAELLEQQTKEAYKGLTPKDVQTKVPFTDEASKVNFEFTYEPDSENFKKAVEIVSDQEKFFATFLNSDGSPNRQLWLDSILYALDKQSIIKEAIKQGSNARMKAQLPDNSTGGLQRHAPTEYQISELDAGMQNAGIPRVAR